MPGHGYTRGCVKITLRLCDFLHFSWRVSQQTGHCSTRTTMSESKADAKTIFLAAVEFKCTEARSRFLDQACGNDVALRQRVEELLDADRDAGGFLGGVEKPEATLDEPQSAPPGTSIGPYKLLELIGEG